MAPRSGRTALLAAVSLLAGAALCLTALWSRSPVPDSLLGFWSSEPNGYVVPISQAQVAKTRTEQQALAAEIGRLDAMRDSMYSQLSQAQGLVPMAVGSAGPHLLADLRGMANDAKQLRMRLNQAASAEEELLVQSQEVADGGCQDHHQESCGAESCCAFWAKHGQCLADHKEWMAVKCSLSCGSCSPSAIAVEDSPAKQATKHSFSAAAMHRHPEQTMHPAPAHAKQQHQGAQDESVDVSMVVHGLEGKASKSELTKAIHRAISALEPHLSSHDVVFDGIEPLHQQHIAHAARSHAPPARSRRAAEEKRMVHEARPALPHLLGSSPIEDEGARERPFGPKRRLMSADGPESPAYRLNFHVRVPRGRDGKQLAEAFKAALREQVQRELRAERHVRARANLERVRHVGRGGMEVAGRQTQSLKGRLSALLGGQPAGEGEEGGPGAGEVGLFDAPEEEKERGPPLRREERDEKMDELFGGEPAAKEEGGEGEPANPMKEEEENAEEEEQEAEKASKEAAKAAEKEEEEERAQKGVIERHPGVGLGTNKAANREEEEREEREEQHREIPWSFQQPLHSEEEGATAPAASSMPRGKGSPEDAAEAVGWQYEEPAYPEEPEKVDEGCDEECLKKLAAEASAGGRRTARLAAMKRQELEERVAVKREHVIEDAKTLKHLMSAIKEEAALLASAQNQTAPEEEREAEGEHPGTHPPGSEGYKIPDYQDGHWYTEEQYGPAFPPPLTKAQKEKKALAEEDKEEEEVEGDELLAAQKRKELYEAKLAAIEKAVAAQEEQLRGQADLLAKKRRVRAIARAKLQAATEEALETAKEEEEERKHLQQIAEAARARVAAYEAKQKEIEEYNLQHDGRVNVQAHFNVDSPKGKHIPAWYRNYLQRLKGSGADRGVVHFNLHVNLDHHKPETEEEKEAQEEAQEQSLASPWRKGYSHQIRKDTRSREERLGKVSKDLDREDDQLQGLSRYFHDLEHDI